MPTTIEIRTSEKQPFVILPVFINGEGPFDFVLDTGAGVSIVTDDLAGTLALHHVEAKDALGAGGSRISVRVRQASTIAVGGSVVENARVGIMKTLPKCIGQGIIGYDFLRHYVLTVDYGHHTLTLAAPEDSRGKDQSLPSSMPLKLARPDRPIILVDVLVNTRKAYQFILDTGASQTVVSPGLAQQMGMKDTRQDSLIGAGGDVTSSAGTLDSLRIGETSLEGVHVIAADVLSPLSQAVRVNIDGILGYNVLRKFKLIVDYPNELLWLDKQ
jgi:predicted aspartyl protease